MDGLTGRREVEATQAKVASYDADDFNVDAMGGCLIGLRCKMYLDAPSIVLPGKNIV